MAPTDRRARLALLTGPSGVGKGSLARLLERHPQVCFRCPRPRSPRDGEQHGVQYFHFVRRLMISWLKGCWSG